MPTRQLRHRRLHRRRVHGVQRRRRGRDHDPVADLSSASGRTAPSARICSSRSGRSSSRCSPTYKAGRFRSPYLWRLSLGGLPGAIIGVVISAHLHNVLDLHQLEHVLRIAVAVALARLRRGHCLQPQARRRLRASPADELPTLRTRADRIFRGSHGEHHVDRCGLAYASAAAARRAGRRPAAAGRHRPRVRGRRARSVAARPLADRRRQPAASRARCCSDRFRVFSLVRIW